MKDLVLSPHLLKVPPYRAGQSIEEIKRKYGLKEVIKLASNENPLGPSPLAVKAVNDAAANMHRYPGVSYGEMCSKLAELVDPAFDEGNVIVGNGSCDILRMIAQSFLHRGGESIICESTFPPYKAYTNMFGGDCVLVEARDYAHDLPAMVEKITDRTRLFFVCNPNNPTGTMLTEQQVDDLMRRVPPHVVVVFDEAYYDYVESGDYADTRRYIREGRNVVTVRTFSKIYGLAGLRLGYGVARKEMIEYLRRALSPFHVNDISIIGAAAALDDAEHVEKSRRVNTEGKKYLCTQFEALGLSYVPTQTNFILLVGFKDNMAVNEALLHKGVIVRPTDGFGLPGGLRVTISTRRENEKLVKALVGSLTH